MSTDRMRFLTVALYVLVLGSSLWLATRIGSSPTAKLAIFLAICAFWYFVLSYVRDVLSGKERERVGAKRMRP
jgi:hypothetical protein